MRKSLWIALMLALALVVPVSAYANPLDSFNSGLDTLLNPNTDVKVDNGLPEDYEPQEVDLYGTKNVRELPENPTSLDYVTNTVDAYNTVPWATANRDLLESIKIFFAFGGAGSYAIIAVPVGIVFFWWGVRKAKSIIWTAFRTGRLNLGTSIKRAYYRRKAKEWYG